MRYIKRQRSCLHPTPDPSPSRGGGKETETDSGEVELCATFERNNAEVSHGSDTLARPCGLTGVPLHQEPLSRGRESHDGACQRDATLLYLWQH